jgi:fucose permease
VQTTANPAKRDSNSSAGPSALWLAAGFLLAGLGTVLLGPILPFLADRWQLTDTQSGILLGAKFLGAFLGGISVPRRLRVGILAGAILCAVGFGAFALSTGLISGAASLFIGGLGLGEIIASTNILAGRRYTSHTGSALASLNFFWSLGAVATGLLAAALLPRFQIRGPVLSFAGLFLVVGLGGLLNPSHADAETVTDPPNKPALPRQTLIHFALLLFLYGGLETCMTGWLTTYTLRFSDAHLLGGQSAVVLLWTALAAGRALASAALRYARESVVQRTGLALSAVFIAALAFTGHAPALSLICILLGLSLAPFFPSTFALLIKQGPSAREAGFILAVSGLGAALFPWLMGVLSTHTGSLRTAMVIPLLLAIAMLLLSLTQREPSQPSAA